MTPAPVMVPILVQLSTPAVQKVDYGNVWRALAMTFAGVKYLAVVIAAVAAWLAGRLGTWGWARFGCPRSEPPLRRWRSAGTSRAHTCRFIYAFAAELTMAFLLAGLLGHLGPAVHASKRHRNPARPVGLAL